MTYEQTPQVPNWMSDQQYEVLAEGDGYTWVSIFVDPALASFILKNLNVTNRPVRESRVQEYRAKMLAGRWNANPAEPLVFGRRDACLVTGQHRLLAVEKTSGTQMVFLFGVPEEFRNDMDTGATQNAGDKISQSLSDRSVRPANVKALAAIANAALSGFSGSHAMHHNTIAYAEANLAHIQKYVAISHRPLVGAPVAAAFAKASIHGMQGVDAAASRFLDQSWSGPGDPMKLLSSRLLKSKVEPKSRYALSVTALRAVHLSRELGVLREADSDINQLDGLKKKGVHDAPANWRQA